eukprot:m.94927 g.94927  ORF g.94927 m.94927 type:complete len:116 (+) comp13468_c0_seq1:568-915(+)
MVCVLEQARLFQHWNMHVVWKGPGGPKEGLQRHLEDKKQRDNITKLSSITTNLYLTKGTFKLARMETKFWETGRFIEMKFAKDFQLLSEDMPDSDEIRDKMAFFMDVRSRSKECR